MQPQPSGKDGAVPGPKQASAPLCNLKLHQKVLRNPEHPALWYCPAPTHLPGSCAPKGPGPACPEGHGNECRVRSCCFSGKGYLGLGHFGGAGSGWHRPTGEHRDVAPRLSSPEPPSHPHWPSSHSGPGCSTTTAPRCPTWSLEEAALPQAEQAAACIHRCIPYQGLLLWSPLFPPEADCTPKPRAGCMLLSQLSSLQGDQEHLGLSRYEPAGSQRGAGHTGSLRAACPGVGAIPTRGLFYFPAQFMAWHVFVNGGE